MVPSHLISALSSEADNVINQVLRLGAPGQKRPTGEVGYVAAVVLGAVPGIAHAWRPILHKHGLTVQMTGVFCHQTPKVTFTDVSGATQQCELSDLLVVADDLRGNLNRRWAALIQAKVANAGGGTTLSAKADLVQLDLMTRWPPFTLPNAYAPGARDFSTCTFAGATIECGRYGLIEPRPNLDWRQQAPAKSMTSGGDTLGQFLARMIETGQNGYGREATGTNDDWSRTVEELIRVTGAQAFTHATSFSGRHLRGHSAIAFISSVDGAHTDNVTEHRFRYFDDVSIPSGGRPDGFEDRENGGGSEGISLLRIGVTETPRRRHL